MKRNSFKYIFYFNIIFLTLCTILIYYRLENTSPTIPVSITTPLVYADNHKADFCKTSGSAVIIDSKSGAILFEKNAHTRRPMASTTKIMTALAIIENSNPQDIIEVHKDAANIEGSSIYLKAGEKLTICDLLYGLMLESGNDAASALAIGVFGSEKNCVDYINKRCHEIGLIDTHFDNVHGLDSENHYTTSYELAKITSIALENPLFRQIVSTKNYSTTGENPRYFSNHNRLLNSFEGAIGVKTGYTSKSGRCLVSAANRGGEEYIAVTLKDSLDWQNHKDMLTFAFREFDSFEIANKENFVIFSGFEKYVPCENTYITTGKDADFNVNYKINFQKDIAFVEYYSDTMKLGEFSMLRCENTPT